MTNWDERFMGMARMVAGWSKDPSMQVGCVITNDKKVAGLGFNGLPRGADDSKVTDKEYKLRYTIHAEENAILNSDRSVLYTTAYIWPLPPCPNCASKLVQAGVNRIVILKPTDKSREKYRTPEVALLLLECGVKFDWVEDIWDA